MPGADRFFADRYAQLLLLPLQAEDRKNSRGAAGNRAPTRRESLCARGGQRWFAISGQHSVVQSAVV